MQFHRFLYISFIAHLVVFGTALAFAHYGGERSGSFSGSLSLSLVGPGGFSKSGGQTKGGRRSQSYSLPKTNGVMPEYAEPVTSSQEQYPSEQNNSTGTVSGTDTAPSGSGDGAGEVGNGGNGSFGPSPEEWDRIQARIEQAKTYPRVARERGIEGVVLLRFRVAPSGSIETVNVVKSSGSPVLDEASVMTLHRAAPLPAVNGWVEVPMSYTMK